MLIFSAVLAEVGVIPSGSLADVISVLVIGWIAFEAIKERF